MWREFVAQFVHFFAVLLWLAAILAALGGVPELAIAIAAVVLVNGIVAFAQEHRAERATERLRDLVPRRALVVRDGRRREIDVEELVPGDTVLVGPGVRIGADLDVVEAHDLRVDESILTGESDLVPVGAGGVLRAGTFLVRGEGVGVVARTGSRTEIGGIAQLEQSLARQPTPLSIGLRRLVRTVAVIALSVGAALFVLMVSVSGTAPSDGFVVAVGITVALVPEGLLPTVMLALSVGAGRMARRNALVRRLEAVETLGSTTFICTDKTGTLTENRMNVVEVWSIDGTFVVDGPGYAPDADVVGDAAAVARAAAVAGIARSCSSGRIVRDESTGVRNATGDPIEAAIDALARRLDACRTASTPTRSTVSARFPFDPRLRRSSTVVDGWVAVKGAPDVVLPLCGSAGKDVASAVEDLAGRGRRVLAVARRRWAGDEPVVDATRSSATSNSSDSWRSTIRRGRRLPRRSLGAGSWVSPWGWSPGTTVRRRCGSQTPSACDGSAIRSCPVTIFRPTSGNSVTSSTATASCCSAWRRPTNSGSPEPSGVAVMSWR